MRKTNKKKLLNTLYITNPDYYLSLEGETVTVLSDKKKIGKIPLHNLESIITCGYMGASPALMGKCAQEGISIIFLSMNGKFLARIVGEQYGNVILRKTQYRVSECEEESLELAKCFIMSKLYNSRWILERAIRDHKLRVDTEALKSASLTLKNSLNSSYECKSMDSLRGIEGEAASIYFGVFNELILQQEEEFSFEFRSRRPPLDRVNALLSFAYVLLTSMCTSALESVGLDPYVGFMHTIRPGRKSLALDLVEELRSVFADRFVITLINKKLILSKHFIEQEDGAVLLNDEGKKLFFKYWQQKKLEVIEHPYLKEKVEWGMVPYVQALLLSRYLRGDLDSYPAFFWK